MPAFAIQLRRGSLLFIAPLKAKAGGGGGNRTRVRKHSTQASTCVVWFLLFRLVSPNQTGSAKASLLDFNLSRGGLPGEASL